MPWKLRDAAAERLEDNAMHSDRRLTCPLLPGWAVGHSGPRIPQRRHAAVRVWPPGPAVVKPFFDDVPAARWRRPDGLLHVYVVPPPAVLEMADAYQQLMAPHTNLVSRQPREFLHYTVQLIDRHLSEISSDQLAALTGALEDHVGPGSPFELTAVHGVVGVHGVTLYTQPPTPQFTGLNLRVRAVVAETLGPDALPDQTRDPVPHLSLGYGLADSDSDPLIRSVSRHRPAPVTFTVDQVHLLAVDQDRAAGTFDWQPLHTINLTGTARR